MPKVYKRRVFKGSRDKYSVEQRGFSAALVDLGVGVQPRYQQSVAVVPSITIQGMRKVKHLTVSVVPDAAVDQLWWALVYVPGGTTAGPLNVSTTGSSLYEPNQFVMNCGVVDPEAGPIRISSPLSRNLNSGDSINLVVGSNVAGSFNACVRYAITLQ